MSKFIYGTELNNEIVKLVKDSFNSLIFISPYIKLHKDLKDEMMNKENKNELKIIIVFGKNESDASKSLPIEELEFFKKFPNLEIKYEERLHAKYYANDVASILTSMNLYDYSFNNNIEFGVLSEQNLIGTNKLDSQSIQYFTGVIDRAEMVFKQEVIIERKLGGLQKQFKGIAIVEDNIDKFYKIGSITKTAAKGVRGKRTGEDKINGYCIRTGAKITFDPSKPFSKAAFESWSKFKNEEYAEKYCHFTGEPSSGETCFKKPILRKNWKEALRHIKNSN